MAPKGKALIIARGKQLSTKLFVSCILGFGTKGRILRKLLDVKRSTQAVLTHRHADKEISRWGH